MRKQNKGSSFIDQQPSYSTHQVSTSNNGNMKQSISKAQNMKKQAVVIVIDESGDEDQKLQKNDGASQRRQKCYMDVNNSNGQKMEDEDQTNYHERNNWKLYSSRGRHDQIPRIKYSKSASKHYFQYKKPSSQTLNSINWTNKIAYFDIETNGKQDQLLNNFIITTIVLFDGQQIKYYINGKNLQQFKQDIEKYKVVVTFSGTSFDLVHTHRFLGIDWSRFIHLDLFYQLDDFGYKKGLKSIKKQLMIQNQLLESANGSLAPLMWNKYQRGNKEYLKLLLLYNLEDVLPLQYLTRKLQFMRLQIEGFSRQQDEDVELIILKKINQKNKRILHDFMIKLELTTQVVQSLLGDIIKTKL